MKIKNNLSGTFIFHSKRAPVELVLQVPSTDPHGFELDENLELTDSLC